MKKIVLTLLLALPFCTQVWAQNPISPFCGQNFYRYYYQNNTNYIDRDITESANGFCQPIGCGSIITCPTFLIPSWNWRVNQSLAAPCPDEARGFVSNSNAGYMSIDFNHVPAGQDYVIHRFTLLDGYVGKFNVYSQWQYRYNSGGSAGCEPDGEEGWITTHSFNVCVLKNSGTQFGQSIVTDGNVQLTPTGTKTVYFRWTNDENLDYCNEVFNDPGSAAIRVVITGDLSTSTTWAPAYQIVDDKTFSGANYTFNNFGNFVATVWIRDKFGNEYPAKSQAFSVKPSCYNDLASIPPIQLSGAGTIETVSNGYLNVNGGYKLEANKEYTIDFSTGVTDFCYNYDLVADDGAPSLSSITSNSTTPTCNPVTNLGGNHMEVTYLGSPGLYKLKVLDDIGSFRLYAVKKSFLGTDCRTFNPLNIFVGGQNLTAPHSPCVVYLPNDLFTLFPELDKVNSTFGTNYVLQHFNYTVSSDRGIVIGSGMVLQSGAVLKINTNYVQPAAEAVDNNKNWVQNRSFDDQGTLIAESKQFFNNRGNATQIQVKNLSHKVILSAETIYDKYGRPAISTLSAPVSGKTITQDVNQCANDIQPGADMYFLYKDKFVSVNNDKLSFKNFDTYTTTTNTTISKLLSPDQLDRTTPGTLGWYYSSNNVVGVGSLNDEQRSFLEPMVASSAYPYSRVTYHEDGTNETKNSTLPGDFHRMGTTHVTESEILPLELSDNTLILDYLTVRNTHVGITGPSDLTGNGYKVLYTDVNQKQTVGYFDRSGNAIISHYLPTGDKAYNFFDATGMLVCTVTPNGVEQLANGTAYADIDKTTYKYNYRGWLLEMDETDAGLTRYMYRRDGTLRFSENAQQRIDGKFSYTNYDRMGRPVESGEFTPDPAYSTPITFESNALKALLEFGAANSNLTLGGTKDEVAVTVYDVPDFASQTSGKITRQDFVSGNISYTSITTGTEVVTSWFSYDERGRVKWLAREISGLGVKKTEYSYDPKGGVKEVAYQKGVAGDEFYHIYTYDSDGRLDKAYTTKTTPVYNGNSLTSQADLLANYEYYLHGPLKREELGEAAQGTDYTYTIQGWLKGINHPDNSKDPGRDGVSGSFFAQDVFSMQLDYFEGDYSKNGTTNEYTSYTSSDTYPSFFNGIIQHNTWYTKKSGTQDGKQGYAYQYNDRYQFARGDFGTAAAVNGAVNVASSVYSERGMTYDRNGNILQLQRFDESASGTPSDNFTYTYSANTNKLSSVSGYADYSYNAIGQMTSTTKSGNTTDYSKFNARGLMQTVSKNTDESDPLVKFYYDDMGMRYKKVTYDETTHQPALTTYYTNDLGGNVLAVYDDNTGGNGIQRKEVYLYGASRIGSMQINNNIDVYNYELKDHLGSVRATVSPVTGQPSNLSFSSSFEGTDEDAFISGIFTYLTTPVHSGSQTLALNKGSGNLVPQSPIWQTKVKPGDEVDLNWYHLGFVGSNHAGDAVAYLVNKSGEMLYSDASGTEAKWVENIAIAGTTQWNLGTLDNLIVPVDLYEANGSKARNEELFFRFYIEVVPSSYTLRIDDLDIQVTYNSSRVLPQATINSTVDYYPWGGPMPDKVIYGALKERYGYQGVFSEKDEETQNLHYMLRDYDANIGRWNSTDIYNQFASTYVGLGNNPVSNIDIDGGYCVPCITAAAGGIIGGGASAYTQWKESGKISWGRVALAAGTGALTASGIGGAYALGFSMGVNMAAEAVDQVWENGGPQNMSEDDLINMGINVGIAGASTFGGGYAGKYMHRIIHKSGVLNRIYSNATGWAANRTSKVISSSWGKTTFQDQSRNFRKSLDGVIDESVGGLVGLGTWKGTQIYNSYMIEPKGPEGRQMGLRMTTFQMSTMQFKNGNKVLDGPKFRKAK